MLGAVWLLLQPTGSFGSDLKQKGLAEAGIFWCAVGLLSFVLDLSLLEGCLTLLVSGC